MRATASPAEGNKIRLSVDVEEEEIERVLDDAIRTLTKEARIPGFRHGKVPRQVLTARMGGATALRAEALREAIPDFYAQALTETETDPISPPEIDITDGLETGALSFDAVVEIRPTVALPGHDGLKVTAPSPVVTDDEVAARVDRLRDVDATLTEVSRPAADGDHVMVDVHGTAGAGADEGDVGKEVIGLDDYSYEVGSGRIADEFDEKLRGASSGDELTFDAAPGDGSVTVSFKVALKTVREKVLPDLTDAWCEENTEWQTADKCRAGVREQLAEAKSTMTRRAATDAAVGALCELFEDDLVPESLVDDELARRVHDLEHDLERRQLGLAQFLSVMGKTSEEFVADVRTEAFRSVKADLALRSLAEVESIEVTDEELDGEVRRLAVLVDMDPETLAEQVGKSGKAVALRSERRKDKALSWLLTHIEVVDDDGAVIDPAAYAPEPDPDPDPEPATAAKKASDGKDDA